MRVLHVVVVEDNDMLARLVRDMIESDPDLEFERGSTDVTELMDPAVWEGVDVAVVDLLLPGATGDTLLDWLATNVPWVRRIAMSGAGEGRLAEVEDAADVVLLKPFMMNDLVEAIRAAS